MPASSLYDFVAGAPKRVPKQLPPKEFTIGSLHIVDLTKVLDPNTETRRCRLWRFNTHGECPYHHDEEWPSVAELPLNQFIGRGLYEVLDELPENAEITAESLEKHLGKKIRPGDTVILDSPYRIPPFTPATNGPTDHRLHVGAESAQWLADHGVQSVGFGDGVTIEDYEANVKPFHDILMAKNVTFLEVLQNLDLLKTDTFFISYAPLPIVGLDSCPVRAYAIEGLAEFS